MRIKGYVWAWVSLLTVAVSISLSDAQAPHSNEFVERTGTRLTLAGEDFRYSGPNVEWLGMEAYGPHDPVGPRYPSHREVDDAFDTAKMMGARVVRSQTMGDSVGCDLCIEPRRGEFNPDAFKVHRLCREGCARPRNAAHYYPGRRLRRL